MLGFIVIVVLGALAYAALNYSAVKKKDAGTEQMQTIAGAIQEGADAFLRLEYKLILRIVLIIGVLLFVVVSWYACAAFILGTIMSASAGWIGMKIATISNVRVSNTAKETKSIGETLKVAFQGGSVMGLSVGGFSLLGLALIYYVFGLKLGQTHPDHLVIVTNWLGIKDIPFTMTVSGYALGCSIIAMFNRVGGGIYTKAADMGADLVGKTEAGIPEDDPRNPATIADNVGDNVGDVAGLGSDLLESFVGAVISAMVLASYIFFSRGHSDNPVSGELIEKLIAYPVFFAAAGLISSMIGIFVLLKSKVSDKPHKELNKATFIAAGLTIITNGVLTWFVFKEYKCHCRGIQDGITLPLDLRCTGCCQRYPDRTDGRTLYQL